jgi:hypothetical protein
MATGTKQSDIAFGTASELSNLDILQSFLDTTLERKGGYAVFDYENPTKTIFVELKTRRIKHDTYDTALIGFNKVAFCETVNDVDYWFAYCYEDGLYVIKYDRELFLDFEVRHDFKRGFREDDSNKPQSVVFIPTNLLKKIDPNMLVNGIKNDVEVENRDGGISTANDVENAENETYCS